jgi:hypothetical protein
MVIARTSEQKICDAVQSVLINSCKAKNPLKILKMKLEILEMLPLDLPTWDKNPG